MLVTENLKQFVLNLFTTELLDSTLFISIYDFVKFDIEKCMKIGEKLYEDIEDNPEDILRCHSSISKKVGNLKNLDFWNRLSNLNFCLMDKADTILMEFEGLFFVKDKKKPILYGTDIFEEEFSTFEFKVENEENKFTKYTGNDAIPARKIESNFEQDILQRQLFNFIKNTWSVYDNDRANDFLGLVHKTKYQEVLEWNSEFIRNLSLTDLQFLLKLKTQIEKGHLYMNHAYAPWDASGFIFDQVVIFHER